MTFSDLDQDYSVVWSQVELSEEDITIISDCCPVCDPPFLHHLPVELSEREDAVGAGGVGGLVVGFCVVSQSARNICFPSVSVMVLVWWWCDFVTTKL